jgi:serine/threonine-protein kinase
MRMDIQRAMNGMAVAAPTRIDNYGRTQQMGSATMMASPTTAVPPYNYGQEDTQGGPPRHRYRALLWVLGLLVVLGAVGALAYMMFGGGGKTDAVPLVVGLPQARAVQYVSKAHLQSKVVDQASSQVARGDVISTNPPQGNTVKANTVVTLYVSTGPQAVSLPNVVGEQFSDAQTKLTNLGLVVKQVLDPASTQPKGEVTKEVPGGPSNVAPGSTVTLSVSGGGANVPNVTGDTQATAQQILQDAGFTVQVKTVAGPPNSTPGDVFQQIPGGSTSAAQGSPIQIFVAAQPTTPTASPTPTTSPSASPTPSATDSGTPAAAVTAAAAPETGHTG